MDEALRAGLLTFAALSALGASPALFRRLEPLGLLLLHAVGLCTAFGAAVAEVLGRGDGRPLLLCYGALIVSAGLAAPRPGLPPRRARALRALPIVLVVAGLALFAIAALGLIGGRFVGPVLGALTAALAVIAGSATAIALLERARGLESERARAADRALAGACLLVGASGVFAALPAAIASGLWPVALAAAGALVTSVRTPPYAPPPAREWLAAALVALVVVFAAAALGAQAAAGRYAAALLLLVVAVLALVRPLLESTRLVQRKVQAPATGKLDEPQPLSAAALAYMAPMIDDAFLRRPGRPRVIARVPARRLLDAALDKARQSHAGARSKKDELRVEVVAADAEVDVDGDPVELSEALCAVLDNALRLKARDADVKVLVHLRGGPGHVTFEVSDLVDGGPALLGPNPDAPFFGASVDVDRPGLGVGLARARLLVEKNGGKLLTRTTSEGSCVQLTIPRRMQKQTFGQA